MNLKLVPYSGHMLLTFWLASPLTLLNKTEANSGHDFCHWQRATLREHHSPQSLLSGLTKYTSSPNSIYLE